MAYCEAHMAQRPKEQIKMVLLVNFTKDEILNAKKMIWETCQSKLDKLVQRLEEPNVQMQMTFSTRF